MAAGSIIGSGTVSNKQDNWYVYQKRYGLLLFGWITYGENHRNLQPKNPIYAAW